MAQANVDSDWKQDPNSYDVELYRNGQLENLEANLSHFELTTLIILENQCYDDSTSKETYDNHLQNLIGMLKEPTVEPPKPTIEAPRPTIEAPKPTVEESKPTIEAPKLRVITPEQRQPVIENHRSNRISSIQDNQQRNYRDLLIKKDLQNSRMRQQADLNAQIEKHMRDKYSAPSKEVKTRDSSRPAYIERIAPNTNHVVSRPTSSRTATLLSSYTPNKNYCDFRRRG